MKITVVTVAFNEEKNIAQTIESVLTQTSNDFELEDLEFIQTTEIEVFNNDGEYYCETY